MDINSLTFGEIKELVKMFGAGATGAPSTPLGISHGKCVVVLDKGFVFIGTLSLEGDFVRVKDAQNVRVYGTAKGLGELALSGPTAKTVMDPAGEVLAPKSSLVFFLPCAK